MSDAPLNLFSQQIAQPSNVLPRDGGCLYFGTVFEAEMATAYLHVLLHSIPWQHDHLVIFGRRIVTQRETAWYGDKRYAYTYSNATKTALSWTAELLEIKELVERLSGESFNSCLLNLYHDGNEGLGWHSDDEDTIVPHSAIASVSFGAERRFEFRHRTTKDKGSLILEHGSLLVMYDETQVHWQHSLPKSKRVTLPRVNLTFRRMVE